MEESTGIKVVNLHQKVIYLIKEVIVTKYGSSVVID